MFRPDLDIIYMTLFCRLWSTAWWSTIPLWTYWSFPNSDPGPLGKYVQWILVFMTLGTSTNFRSIHWHNTWIHQNMSRSDSARSSQFLRAFLLDTFLPSNGIMTYWHSYLTFLVTVNSSWPLSVSNGYWLSSSFFLSRRTFL